MIPGELVLTEGPEAVPAGRQWARAALAGRLPSSVVDAVELVVTELLTNAVLHGARPVRLAVRAEPDGSALVEVQDSSATLPVRPRRSDDGMTGRGLALVDAVAHEWGVRPVGDGKGVWARLTEASVADEAPADVDLATLLAAFEEHEPAGRRVTVVLGDVPTDLLLAAKAHVDGVVRELELAAGGARSGMTAAVPSGLAALLHDVVVEFAEARQAVKRQALAAAADGAERTTLTLRLPPDAADAGERYLAALEQADAWARTARLLTVAAPPQHAAFRRWYVSALVDGLRRAQVDPAGRATASRTFEQHLLGEVEELAELKAVSDRAARLQRGTAALAGTVSEDEVTRIVLDDAVAELGAARGTVLLVRPGTGLVVSAVVGYDAQVAEALTAGWAGGAHTPGRQAYETGQPVWVESREERDAGWPDFARLEPDALATCAVPVRVGERVAGVLRLSFLEPRLLSDDERAFLGALAAVASQALERAELFRASRRLSDDLSRLQRVTSALAAAPGEPEVLAAAVEHAVGLVGARIASISLLDPDGRTVRLAAMLPPLPDDSPWHAFGLDDDVPAAEAIRTGRAVSVADLASRDARWPAIAGTARDFEHAFVVVPLRADDRALGAMTFAFPADAAPDSTGQAQPPLQVLTAFADACASALRRTRSAEGQAASTRRLAFLARVSEELAAGVDVDDTVQRVTRLAVPEVGDWCVVHLLQDHELACVALEHPDPAQRELGLQMQQRWPETLQSPGIGEVVRDGQTVFVASVPDARAALAAQQLAPVTGEEAEHAAAVDRLGIQSVVIAPLRARGRTLGALTLLTAESGRTYGTQDQALVEDLARRVAVAVDNARLHQLATGRVPEQRGEGFVQPARPASLPAASDDAVLRWHLAQEAAQVGSWEIAAATGTIRWDEQCARLFGTRLEDFSHDLAGFEALTVAEDVPRVLAALERTLETGEPLEVEFRTRGNDGRPRHLLSRGRAVRGVDGAVVRVLGAVLDVSVLQELTAAQRRSADAVAGLGRLALDLAAAADLDGLVAVVTSDGLGVLGADSAAMSVLSGRVLRTVVSDSLGDRVARDYAEVPLDAPLPGPDAVRRGEPVLLADRAACTAAYPAMQAAYEATGREAWAFLPLSTARGSLGVLSVGWTQPQPFGDAERELLVAFAAQCAQALERLQALEAERASALAARTLSETLQRSLLTRPPEPDHLQVAVRYVPASQEAQVGGDWYDAFFTPDDALCVVIGDCAGHDREAVAAMAAVRNLLRATTYATDLPPAQVFTALERTMAGLDVEALATAVMARIEQTPEQRARGVRALRWTNAGHPPPVVRYPDGETLLLETPPDLLLGLLTDTPRFDHVVELTAGATLVLCTDGLVERRGEDLDTGLERLRAAVAELGGLPLEELSDELLARLGRDAEDDVALLAVRFHDERSPRGA